MDEQDKTPDTINASQDKPQADNGQDNQTVTFTQSELDKAVAKALSTRENNLKSEMEKVRLQEKGEFEKLLDIERREKNELKENQTRKDFIIQNNLTHLAKFFSNVPVDQLDAVKGELTGAINAQMQAEIKRQLKTTEPAGNDPAKPVSINTMTDEQYKTWRENQNKVF